METAMGNDRRWMNRRWLVLSAVGWVLSAVWWVVSAAVVSADPAHLIRYQGQAVDSQGVPLEGPYTLTFRLYDAATVGTELWEEVQPNVPLTGGHFSILLGQVTRLNTLDWSQPRWLSVQVGADPELAPRQQITSVPLAIRAEQAEQLTQAITPALITPQGAGSGLDADTVDGRHATDLVNVSDPAGGDLSGSYPAPTVSKLYNRPVSSAAPSNGQVLKWDGAQWGPAAAGFTRMQVFTSSGTWVRPPDVNTVWVRVWGGGGGADGDGGGGGGGGYGEDIVTVIGNVIVTVGAGGAAGRGGGVGSAGGQSSFGTLVVANGGGGGSGTTGGAGGTGSTGAILATGEDGISGAQKRDGGMAAGGGGVGGRGENGSGAEGQPGKTPSGGGASWTTGNNGGAGAAGSVLVYW